MNVLQLGLLHKMQKIHYLLYVMSSCSRLQKTLLHFVHLVPVVYIYVEIL